MKQLLHYELKKIMMKKSTIVAFLILFVLNTVFVGISGSLGSTYVDGEFYETHEERNKIVRENGLELSGRKIDDVLLAEMQEVYRKIDWSTPAYKWTDIYKDEVRKYEDVELRLKMWGLKSSVLSDTVAEEFAGTTRGERIYLAREEVQNQIYDAYLLSEVERTFWEEKDTSVETPFTYQYAAAYESLIDMQGIYMICMLVSFFIAVTMVSVFSDEHIKKTDQLVLCTRYGRKQAYLAKSLAGSLVTFAVTVLFLVVAVVGKFYSYGKEGFGASIQVALAYWYPYELSIGEACLISMGLLLLSSVLVAIFTMILAELLRNSVGAMAVVVGLLFAARLVEFPTVWRLISQLWNYMPINLVKMDQGFTDLRTIGLFGAQLTTWQFAPILYTVLIVIFVVCGSRLYQSYQVSGR